jgi:uncharacterized protein (DUF1778 family)
MAGKPKSPGQVKGFMLRVRMTEAERDLLEQAARERSLSVSALVRSESVASAKRILKSAKSL